MTSGVINEREGVRKGDWFDMICQNNILIHVIRVTDERVRENK